MRRSVRTTLFLFIILGTTAGAVWFYRYAKSRPDHTKNVVLVVVDAMRADHLSCYGYPLHTTPNIDRFAQSGAVFDRAFCPVPATQPSFATLLTSLHAYSHGVQRHGVALSNKAITLAEILKAKGWDTGAVVGASNLDSIFGFSQGFDFYEDHLGKKENTRKLDSRKRWERNAAEVNLHVAKWLTERSKKRPFFLMIHYFDTHHPYSAPPPFDTMYPPGNTEESGWRASYDGEVSFVDSQFGELIRKLKELHLSENTLIILTSDHGENLGEHHWKGHDQRIQDEAVHIPLILSGPGIAAGKHYNSLVQNVDLAPAILEYLRLPQPKTFQGRSLLRVLKGENIRDFVFLQIAKRPDNFAKLTPDWQKYPEKVWAVRTSSEKLIWSSDGKHEFYDLNKDPLELNNIYELKKARAAELEKVGRDFLNKYPQYSYGSGPQKRESDNDPEEAMRALGYIN